VLGTAGFMKRVKKYLKSHLNRGMHTRESTFHIESALFKEKGGTGVIKGGRGVAFLRCSDTLGFTSYFQESQVSPGQGA
jgi:hypothetical protein